MMYISSNACAGCKTGLFMSWNQYSLERYKYCTECYLKRTNMCIEEKKVKDCTRTELETYLADQDIEEAFNKLAGVIKELKDKGFHFTVSGNCARLIVNKKSKSRGVEL